MFFEVLDVTYHSPITIDYITCATDVDAHGLVPHRLGSAIDRELSGCSDSRPPGGTESTLLVPSEDRSTDGHAFVPARR